MNILLTSLCIYIEANSTGKSNLEEDYARERENLFLIGFELLRGIYIYVGKFRRCKIGSDFVWISNRFVQEGRGFWDSSFSPHQKKFLINDTTMEN